jgi:hypothetical protein
MNYRTVLIVIATVMLQTTAVRADVNVGDSLWTDVTVSDSLQAEASPTDTVVKKGSFWKRLSDKLTTRYYTSKYDSCYVVRPQSKLTLKVRMNMTGNSFYSRGTINGFWSEADLSTGHNTTFSVAAVYCGIGLGVAVNPSKWKGIYNDYEFNLNFYGRCLSLDLSYQRSKSLSGDFHSDWGDQRLEKDDTKLKMLNVAVYYAFNNRRFSYPAAFTQSYIQRRSAGSWLAGISYQGGSITTTEELKQRVPEASEVTIEFGHLGIGGGYGYNWVPGKRWLLHLSALPNAVILNRNKMIVDGEYIDAQRIRFNMIFNWRVAVVYNFSTRYFAGATMVGNHSIFDDDSGVVKQDKWRARFCIGMRL